MFSFLARLFAKLFKTEKRERTSAEIENTTHRPGTEFEDPDYRGYIPKVPLTRKTPVPKKNRTHKPAGTRSKAKTPAAAKPIRAKQPEFKAPLRKKAAPVPLAQKKPEWDIHESVFLLSEYLAIVQNNTPLDETAWRISLDLRRMAKNRGLTIDDAFRGESGVKNRLRGMEAAYTGKSGAAPVLRQFVKAVELYRKERERYSKILDEAKYMVVGVPNAGRQPAWDICESVLLLDGYLEAAQGKSPQDEVIARVSAGLRRMAANRGRLIDSAYRDEKEIVCRMYNIAYAYKGETVFMPEVKAFGDAVEMYYNDRQRYLETLEQAKALAAGGQSPQKRPGIEIQTPDEEDPANGHEKTAVRRHDVHEAALLRDACLEIHQGEKTRHEIAPAPQSLAAVAANAEEEYYDY